MQKAKKELTAEILKWAFTLPNYTEVEKEPIYDFIECYLIHLESRYKNFSAIDFKNEFNLNN